ncbi:MAG: HD domain-containing protein [Candidatus Moranbacteria bacterium]|nr:HD domain-containing protein [Candidatus Moranbacteria bacterium]
MNFITPPFHIIHILKSLRQKDFESYLVGGCVRDILLEKKPKDWDIATNATPDQMLKIFPESFYENKFGTVGIKDRKTKSIVEITTYRTEKNYKDHRHPLTVKFSKNINEDLERRDFTINAMALDPFSKKIIDPFKGQSDLKNQIIRSVKNPDQRFREDALRLIRAVRFANELNFKIDPPTYASIIKNSGLLQKISKERIKEEFNKIILSKTPAEGIELLRKTGLLKQIIPELTNTLGVKQNLHHQRTVYDHILHTLRNCKSKKLSVRLAALFHDIAKPQTKRGHGPKSTFYNHEYASAKMVRRILKRLRYSEKIIKHTSLLVKNHMFYYEVDKVTPSSVRRLISKVGRKNIQDLMDLRIADRLGSDCPKAKPYKLRHLEYLIDKVSKDPVSVKMLAVNGNLLHQKAGVEKGPKMGAILDVLLSKVLENPKNNNQNFLIREAKKLNQQNINSLRKKALNKIRNIEKEKDLKLKNKHWVK